MDDLWSPHEFAQLPIQKFSPTCARQSVEVCGRSKHCSLVKLCDSSLAMQTLSPTRYYGVHSDWIDPRVCIWISIVLDYRITSPYTSWPSQLRWNLASSSWGAYSIGPDLRSTSAILISLQVRKKLPCPTTGGAPTNRKRWLLQLTSIGTV